MRHSFVSPGAVLMAEIEPVRTLLALSNPIAKNGFSVISVLPEILKTDATAFDDVVSAHVLPAAKLPNNSPSNIRVARTRTRARQRGNLCSNGRGADAADRGAPTPVQDIGSA